ncbi:hypothetical protein [Gluconacetobacter sacchari]|uniref:hypothetical protein n=1 Tax=Gluconacetobacter sacchari TaxID=92759 RepID=UPI002231EC41|nr:hypothetical protein [Gluconacetobacter sacchari]
MIIIDLHPIIQKFHGPSVDNQKNPNYRFKISQAATVTLPAVRQRCMSYAPTHT